MFSTLLTQSVTLSRLTAGSGIQKVYQELNTYPTLIEPLSDQAHLAWGMTMGLGYHAYFDIDTDIQVSDKLCDQDGNNYTVAGIRKRNYGAGAHQTAYIVMEPGK